MFQKKKLDGLSLQRRGELLAVGSHLNCFIHGSMDVCLGKSDHVL